MTRKRLLGGGTINKKIILLLLIGFLFLIGVSYALWQITLIQEDKNIVTSACFEITLEEQNDILLNNAYPITESEGQALTPYTFKITNVCGTTAMYQVNLEELEITGKKLSSDYVSVSLNKSKGKILSTYEVTEKTLSNATNSHKLTTGTLREGESKTYELRLWMDYDTPPNDEVMESSFESKITIVAIHNDDLPEVEIIAQEQLDGITVDISTVSNPKNEKLTYFYRLNEEAEIESSENTHTFTGLSDGKYKAKGRAETTDGLILEEKELDVTVAYEKVYISNTGNDETGNGSLENPYASLQPAYNKVKSGGEMILLSNITATSTTNMNTTNKQITLKSNGTNKYSITKASNLTSQILYLTNSNNLTVDNIIFDGNNVESTGSLIEGFSSTITLNNTTVQNNINNGRIYSEWNKELSCGGGVLVADGKLIINGGTIIQNNKVKHSVRAFGGGVTTWNSIVELNGGTITNNSVMDASSYQRGGGIVIWGSTLQFINGLIEYNQSKDGAGIFVGDGSIIDNIGKASVINMRGGTVDHNTADLSTGYGGGVYITGNTEFNMTGGNITNNSSADGGGVMLIGTTYNISMNMTNGQIINNIAKNGGGIYVHRGSANIQVIAYLKGGTISNNTAPTGSNTYAMNGAQIIDER